jgi:hypothetical protein
VEEANGALRDLNPDWCLVSYEHLP